MFRKIPKAVRVGCIQEDECSLPVDMGVPIEAPVKMSVDRTNWPLTGMANSCLSRSVRQYLMVLFMMVFEYVLYVSTSWKGLELWLRTILDNALSPF